MMDRAHTVNMSVRRYLRAAHPEAQWDAIDDLGRALSHELYFGPMPYGYWNDKAGGDCLCVLWIGFSESCKHLSELLEALPVEVWYDHESGCIDEGDPWQDERNWERDCEGHPNDGNGPIGVTQFCDGTCREPDYIGPTEVQTVPTIEALFTKELWRYLT